MQAGRWFVRVVPLLGLLHGGAAEAGPRDDMLAEATAAIAAAAAPATLRFRGLSAFIQYTDVGIVCGEVSRGAGGGDGWHPFFARRKEGAWSYEAYRRTESLADHAACTADIRRNLDATERGPPEALDGVRRDGDAIAARCPIESGLFWFDYQMACAGHPVP